MLRKFEVQNFKSFKDNFVFDLSDIKNYEFNSECIKNELVCKSIIYGPNGCGKSNLGLAIFDLVSHLTDKYCDKELYDNYINAYSDEEVARFRYEFIFNDCVLEYSYGKKQRGLVTNETLVINNIEVVSYTRGKQVNINLKGAETLNTDLSGSRISALKYIKNNTILSNKFKVNRALNSFYNFVDRMLFFRSLESTEFIGYEIGSSSIMLDIIKNNHLDEFEHFLNSAGIKCKLKVVEINGTAEIAFDYGKKYLRFVSAASTGTRSLGLFYFWLQRLSKKNEVSFVFIDEFDAYYHHRLSEIVVSHLKKIQAQAILTTHNTTIMSNELMRPDCCFSMQNDCIKPFHRLTDKELRLAHNIEKIYRSGAFNG